MFTRDDAGLTSAAQRQLCSLPSTFINLFKKKRRLIPVWSTYKYTVVIKSNYMVYSRAGKQQDDDKKNRYIDLRTCDIRSVNDDAAGYVFAIQAENGKMFQFLADTEKERTKFIDEVHKIQRRKVLGLSDFENISVIGKGHYGRVLLVREKNSQELYALKEMKIGHTKTKVVLAERSVMEWVGDHPFTLHLDYAFCNGKNLYLVSKFMAGGDLFMHMHRHGGRFNEDEVRFYSCEIILALEHMHSLCIIHRDVKPENILLEPDGHIRVGDMGLAKKINSYYETTHTMCGTDAYLAPEMVTRDPAGHGRSADMWQLGCLMFELFMGHPPFYSPSSTQNQTHHRIMYETPRFPLSMSKDLTSLLTGLLMKNSSERLGNKNGMAEVKQHPFYSKVNWKDVYDRKYTPPSVPSPAGNSLVDNFDTQFTSLPHDISMGKKGLIFKDFAGFDYVNPMYSYVTSSDPAMELQSLSIREE